MVSEVSQPGRSQKSFRVDFEGAVENATSIELRETYIILPLPLPKLTM